MLTIRPFHSSDAGALAALISGLGYKVDPDELRSRVEKMPPDSYTTLVALADNQIAGFIGLLVLPVYEHSRPIGWILALSVSELHRRKGIGKALLHAAETHGRASGVVDIRLHSGLQRDDAHVFYERMGFDKSGYRFKKALS